MARTSIFWLCLVGILLAGAAEVTFAQWTSAFAQAALGFSQVVADWAGFGMFAAMMVVGRLWFGLRGHSMRLPPLLIGGAAITALCYAVAALARAPWLSLGACVLAGFFVSMLWPGIVSLSANAFPRAGISLFAVLAASGDSGAGGVPWLVGAVADRITASVAAGGTVIPSWIPAIDPAAAGLRVGLLVAGACPALLVPVLWMIAKRAKSAP